MDELHKQGFEKIHAGHSQLSISVADKLLLMNEMGGAQCGVLPARWCNEKIKNTDVFGCVGAVEFV